LNSNSSSSESEKVVDEVILLNFWKRGRKKDHEEEHAKVSAELDHLEEKTDRLAVTMRRLELETEALVQRTKRRVARGA
jgi:hypothetical protein